MLPIIVAIFLAFSAVGGGMAYVAHENATTSGSASGAFNAAQMPAGHTTTPGDQDDMTATPTPGASETATATATATATLSPTATATSTSTPTPTTSVTITPTASVTITPTTSVTPSATASETPESDDQGGGRDSDSHGQAWRGLLAKLDAAIAAHDRGNDQAAMNILNAIAHQLNAMERSGQISQSQYDDLFAKYTSLVSSLNGTPVPTVTPQPTPTEEVEATVTETPEKHSDKSKDGDDRGVFPTGTPQPTFQLPSQSDDHGKSGNAGQGNSGTRGGSHGNRGSQQGDSKDGGGKDR